MNDAGADCSMAVWNGRQVELLQCLLADRLVVAAVRVLLLVVGGHVLDHGHHALALQALNLRRGDLAGQVGVLAVGLVGPAPARVAHQVGCRAERDVHALARELGAHRRALLLDQRRVPGRGGVLAVGEGRHAAVPVTDSGRAVLQVDGGDAQVGDGGDLADVRRGAVTGEQADLFRLVHGVEHLLDPLGDRRGGADPRADCRCRRCRCRR